MRIAALAAILIGGQALASDHANLDAGRPLRFTDAYSAAQGAREFQLGAEGSSFSAVGLPIEFKLGYAPNRDIAIGVNPILGRKSTLDSVHLAHFQTFAGETETEGAFGLRLTADLPLDSGKPAGAGVMGAWSRYQGSGVWRHINLGYESQGSVTTGILGFSRRDGLNQMTLAEFGLSSVEKWIGVGLRRQLTLSTVIDIGVEHKLGSNQGLVRLGFTQSY